MVEYHCKYKRSFCFFTCSNEGLKSCQWVTEGVRDMMGEIKFQVSHSLSPYAEENTMMEVTAEAIIGLSIVRKIKKFFLRDISEWKHLNDNMFSQWSWLRSTSPSVLHLGLWYIWKQNEENITFTDKNKISREYAGIQNWLHSSLQFSPIVPRSSAIKRWARIWTWALSRRPAGQLLTATSAWNTKFNIDSGMTTRYLQFYTKI